MADNELERVRLKLGLSKRQMLVLLGAHPDRDRPFSQPAHRLDPIFIVRAAELEVLYDQWKLSVLEQARNEKPATFPVTAELLDMQPMTLYVLCRRHTEIWCEQLPLRTTAITSEHVEQLFRYNERFLSSGARRRNGPLAVCFLRWLRKKRPAFLRTARRSEKVVL